MPSFWSRRVVAGQPLKLSFVRIVEVQLRAKSRFNGKISVNRTIAEYLGDDGQIYRKSFEVRSVVERGGYGRSQYRADPNNTRADVPVLGTHNELDAREKQW